MGIGTTSPTRKFVVSNGGASGIEIEPNYVSGVNEILSFNRTPGATAYETMRFNGGDFQFQTSGSEKMRITSGGRVGIGTTNPTANLHVYTSTNSSTIEVGRGAGRSSIKASADADGGYLALDSSGNGLILNHYSSDNVWLVTGGGNVGVGTTGPSQKLHVSGNARVTGAYYDSNNSPGTANQVLVSTATGTDWVDASGSSIIGGPYLPLVGGTMTGTNGVVFPDSFELKLGTGNDAQIKHDGSHLFIDNSVGNSYLRNTSTGSILLRNSTGGDIQFDNEFAGNILFNTSNIERMRIDSSGNVGVGTTTLTNSSGYKTLSISGSAGAQIAFQTSGTGKSFIFNDATDFYIYNSEAGNLRLFTAATERMRIDSSGNVGIGLTPNVSYSKLQIKTPSSAYGLDLVGRDAGSSSESQITFWNSNQTSVLAAIVNSSDSLLFYTGTTERLRISSAGAIKFNAYDSTNQTGTPTYLLGTDGSGNIVKTLPQGSGTAGPYLPLAGGTMTGVTQFNDHTQHGDQVQARWGASNDFTIEHNATDSSITNITGDLYITNKADDKDIVFRSDDGSGGFTTYFKLDGSTEQNVVSKNMRFEDSIQAQFGAGTDLRIYHDGSNSYIKDTGTGILAIQGNIIALENTSGVNYFVGVDGAQTELYYNGSSQLQTTSTGVAVTGDINIDSALLSNQENTDVDTGTETVASVAIATYTAAFFDFVIKKTTNVRSGTVYACHDGTNVEFTETSTQDLGDTSDVTLSVDISGGNMRLRATTTSDDWSIKSLIRAI